MKDEIKLELIKRYSAWRDKDAGLEGVEWVINNKLTKVSTRTAFALAKGGFSVTCVDIDCDYELEVDVQDEHYPNKDKSYPEIETIFIVKGEL